MGVYGAFTRLQLAEVLVDVRANVKGVRVSEAWVYDLGRHHWEFHYGEFYWHGSAGGAYDARAKGWAAYLRKLGVEGYDNDND